MKLVNRDQEIAEAITDGYVGTPEMLQLEIAEVQRIYREGTTLVSGLGELCPYESEQQLWEEFKIQVLN